MFYLAENITKIPKLMIAVGVILRSMVSTVHSDDLTLSQSTGSYSAGQTFNATIRAVPNGSNVNAVESTLSFDPAVLSVVNVSRDGSVFTLWTTEPTFSNSAGTIEFGGGSPSPFTSTSNLLTVTFRAVAAGDVTVSFDDASVLAADGLGTDVFENATPANYTITAATTPQPTPEPEPTTPSEGVDADEDGEAIIFGDPPRPPEIGSQMFLDPDLWYSETDGVFTWTLPFDVNAVAIEISNDPENVPQDNEDAIIDPPVEEFVVNDELVSDGVQYVSVNFQNQVGWGAVTNRKLQIDTTPPEPFAINVQNGNTQSAFPTLRFEANDITSGIDYYEMTIADNEPVRITPDEAQLGYLMGELEDGTYTVKVEAVDMAGNVRESSVPVLIDAGWIAPVEVEDEGSFWDFFTAANIFILFVFVIVLLQII